MLPVKTHWQYNPESKPSLEAAYPLVLLVKGNTLAFVQKLLDLHSSDKGPLAAAIALLAAWEMVGVG